MTGLLADVGDVDGLTQAALNILRDRAVRVRMGQAARERALRDFHPSIIVPQYLRAYRQTLADWRAGQ